MKKNTNEYLGALNVLETKKLKKDTTQYMLNYLGVGIASIGFALIFLNLGGLLIIIIGVIIAYTEIETSETKDVEIKIKELTEKYNNEEDFSDIIAEL